MTIRRRASFAMSRRSVRFVWIVAILAFLGVALVLGFVVSLASGRHTATIRKVRRGGSIVSSMALG